MEIKVRVFAHACNVLIILHGIKKSTIRIEKTKPVGIFVYQQLALVKLSRYTKLQSQHIYKSSEIRKKKYK